MPLPTITFGTPYISSAQSTTHVIPAPAGITAGEKLGVIFTCEQTGNQYSSNDGGFSLDANSLDGTADVRTNIGLLTKTAVGDETDLTITIAGSFQLSAIFFRTDASDVLLAATSFVQTLGASTVAFPDVTTDDDNSTLIYACMADGIVNSIESGNGPGSEIASNVTGSPSAHAFGYAYEDIATQGTVTGREWTMAASQDVGGIVVELTAAVASGTPGLVLSTELAKNGNDNASAANTNLISKTFSASFSVGGVAVSGAPATIATDASGYFSDIALSVDVDDVVDIVLTHPDFGYDIVVSYVAELVSV